MTDDEDWSDIIGQSPATDELAAFFRWLGLIGAMGLFGLAILAAAEEIRRVRCVIAGSSGLKRERIVYLDHCRMRVPGA